MQHFHYNAIQLLINLLITDKWCMSKRSSQSFSGNYPWKQPQTRYTYSLVQKKSTTVVFDMDSSSFKSENDSSSSSSSLDGGASSNEGPTPILLHSKGMSWLLFTIHRIRSWLDNQGQLSPVCRMWACRFCAQMGRHSVSCRATCRDTSLVTSQTQENVVSARFSKRHDICQHVGKFPTCR